MKLPKVYIDTSPISGFGLFAGEDIGWGKPIIYYTGQKISKRQASKRAAFYDKLGVTYLFSLGDKYEIDGLVGGNHSKFINHSTTPNCSYIRIKNTILIHANEENIWKGEELTINYGFKP